MKILALNKFHFVFGGSDRYFFSLNDLLSEKGHQVIPFSMQHPRNQDSEYKDYFVSQVDFREARSAAQKAKAVGRIFYSPEARRKLKALIERTQPDIAHIHLIYHQISPSILPILREAGIPVVQTLHDYKPICPTYRMVSRGQVCERCKGKRFYQAALEGCNRGSRVLSLINSLEMYLHHTLGYYDEQVDLFLASSDFQRRKMIEFGMPAAKIHWLPNFLDVRRHVPRYRSEGYFAYVGRLVEEKGLITLLQAMRNVNSGELYVIGDGPQRKELESLKAEWNLSNVQFLGYRSGAELKDLVSHAQFTVVPSEWYENCPLSVLESLAAGKPVVAANIGGLPELIDHGQDGYLFEPGNPADLSKRLNQLTADTSLQVAFGKKARTKVEARYNPALHYELIMGYYQNVLDRL